MCRNLGVQKTFHRKRENNMAKQFVYVDLGEGKKAIQAGEDGLPMFEEETGKDEEGNPVYVQKTADVFHLLEKVPSLSKDLDAYKTKLRNAKTVVSPLIDKGILKEEDLFGGNKDSFDGWFSEANGSIEKVKSFDSIKMKDIDEMKKQLDKSTKERIESVQKEFISKEEKYKNDLTDAESTIRKLMISDKFTASDFLKKNCDHVPADVIFANFGNRFKVEKDEDGNRRTVGYTPEGKPVYSITKTGDIADFEEAVSIMIREDKNAGFYLKGISGSGTGGGPGRANMNSMKDRIAQLEAAGDFVEANAIKRHLKNQG